MTTLTSGRRLERWRFDALVDRPSSDLVVEIAGGRSVGRRIDPNCRRLRGPDQPPKVNPWCLDAHTCYHDRSDDGRYIIFMDVFCLSVGLRISTASVNAPKPVMRMMGVCCVDGCSER